MVINKLSTVASAEATAVSQPVRSQARALWISLRPRQWIKNLLVFAALLFSQNLFNPLLVGKAVLGFFCFCAISSGVYLMNDLKDLEMDRLHPVKRLRPLAAGKLSEGVARWASITLMGVGLALSVLLAVPFGVVAAIYLGVQMAYVWWLKEVIILDIICVSTGFVLRAVAGGLVVAVHISSWLIVCTIMLGLFLALAKRRHELTILKEEATSHRPSLQEYSLQLLDQMIAVVTASTLMSYILYTLSDVTAKKFGTDNLKYTIPFVLYGILRYLYLVHKRELGGQPEITLLTDKPLLISIALYVMTVGIILYL
ncbi:decaprenyl-phosphate phosphoribosyltransferase [Nitrospinae bacterium AH_259_B05_G02_I21]|nr:decaprenyl-phosphate phosphoribosyltransferase [Nitrospinae bacterium AH_259_B05_G02_I21]